MLVVPTGSARAAGAFPTKPASSGAPPGRPDSIAGAEGNRHVAEGSQDEADTERIEEGVAGVLGGGPANTVEPPPQQESEPIAVEGERHVREIHADPRSRGPTAKAGGLRVEAR